MAISIKKIESSIIESFIKYLFFIAILPKTVQAIIVAIIVLVLIIINKKVIIDKRALPFILISVLHIVSIIINMNFNHVDRIIAAFNTAFLWLAGGLVYSFAKKASININHLRKACFINCVILIFLAVIYIIVQNIGITNIGIFNRFLIGDDWSYGERGLRLVGFMEYSNLISLMYFMNIPFAIQNKFFGNRIPLMICFMVVALLPVIFCGSRIGAVVAIASSALMALKIMADKTRASRVLLVLFGMAIILISPFMSASIYAKIGDLVDSRQGSTSQRMIIYRKSIEETWNESPIIGKGVKRMIGDYPLGSHSTYIGFFYKTGLLGLFFGIVGAVGIVKEKIIQKDWIQFIALLALLIVLLFEDLDGANWLIFAFFILIAPSVERRSLI